MSWAEKTIGDLVELQRGHDLPDSARKPGTVPVIGSAGLTGYHNVAKSKGPGVTLGRSGASIGKVTYVPQDFWPHNACLYVKNFKGNDPRFVAYLLRTVPLAQLNSGAAQPSLNRNFVYGVKIKFPKPTDQMKVVDVLDKYDDLIENNKRRIELLEDSARQLYKEWFVRLRFPGHEHIKIIDGTPEGWYQGAISDFFDTTSGGTPSRNNPDFYTGDINWVKTQELNEGFILSTEEKITGEALSKSSAKLFPENTLLVSMYGGTNIGRTGILATPAASNQACCALFPKDGRAHYIFASLYFYYKRSELIAMSQGAAQTNVNQQTIRGLKIVLPPTSLMGIFIGKLTPVYEQIKTLQKETKHLIDARDLLLPKLMSGEIAV